MALIKFSKSQYLYLLLGFLFIWFSWREQNFSQLIHFSIIFIATLAYFKISLTNLFKSGLFYFSFIFLLLHSQLYFSASYTNLSQETSPASYIVFSILFLLVAWNCLKQSAAGTSSPKITKLWDLMTPFLFGVVIIFIWQMIVIGFRIPFVLLPTPQIIFQSLFSNKEIFLADFLQTFVYAVIPGYLMGCFSAFLVALVCDKVFFFKQGLLPLGNFMSALPIVGVAPIMIMWFGFDWQSKAAVIVLMTFFPMLVNSIVGLANTSKMELDLLETYNPNYLQRLIYVRLPNAAPFIFNGLKINSTLALIGGIVAEFFGTPIVGMGFRISTEIGRMNLHLVWATIIVSAFVGSIFYLLLVILEKKITFWHISIRSS